VLGTGATTAGRYAAAAEAGMWCVAGLMALASVLVAVLLRTGRQSASA
jgi:hypothetical protein